MSAIDLSGKVAVVTGGSRGLGLAVARGLSSAGATVAVASRKLAGCVAVADELIAAGGRASPHAFDAGSWEQCDRLFDQVTQRWGGAQILVNNAGMSPVAPSSLLTSEELFNKIVAVNLRAVFRLSALFGAQMQAQGGGAIVNISSSGALRPRPDRSEHAGAHLDRNPPAPLGRGHKMPAEI